MYSRTKGSFFLIHSLTIARIPVSILIAFTLFFFDSQSIDIIIFVLTLIAFIEISDLLDGFLARKLNVVSELGAMLDPYADSISRLVLFWSFSIAGLVITLVPLSMAIRDITVAYCRITLTRNNKTVSAKLSGKIKAIIQGVCAFVIVAGPLYWKYTGEWIIYFFSWVVIVATLASIFEYAKAAIVSATE